MIAAAPRSPRGHHSFRSQTRALMYVGEHGALVELSPRDARELIAAHGSIRRAAAALGIPRSTLHDLATNTGKRPSHVPQRGRR